jgi:hypothetical protein
MKMVIRWNEMGMLVLASALACAAAVKKTVVDRETFESWEAGWQKNRIDTHEYDSSGNDVKTTTYYLAPDLYYVFDRNYDLDNRLVLETEKFLWKGLWTDILKDTNKYDGKNRWYYEAKWELRDSLWINTDKNVRTYYADGNWDQMRTQRSLSSPDTSAYRIRSVVTNNPKGQEVLSISGLWYDDLKKWFNPAKDSTIYDDEGRTWKVIRSYFDSVKSAWVEAGHFQHTYNSRGLEVEYESNISLGGVENMHRQLTIYDAEGRKTAWFDQNWGNEDTEQLAWITLSKETYLYDSSGNEVEMVRMERNSATKALDSASRRFLTYKTLDINSPNAIPHFPRRPSAQYNLEGKWLELISADGKTLGTLEYKGPETMTAIRKSRGPVLLRIKGENRVFIPQ